MKMKFLFKLVALIQSLVLSVAAMMLVSVLRGNSISPILNHGRIVVLLFMRILILLILFHIRIM